MIVLTGQAVAVARAAPGPAGQMELCTGNGPVMVYVDNSGAPVSPPHLCPEFALGLLLAVAQPSQFAQKVDVARRLPAVRADLQNTELQLPRMLARAPPVEF